MKRRKNRRKSVWLVEMGEKSENCGAWEFSHRAHSLGVKWISSQFGRENRQNE